MRTENQTEKKIDDQILNANSETDVSEPTGKHDGHTVYWILRDRFGFSHFGAVQMTHALFTGGAGAIVVKSWKDLKRPEVVAFVKSKKEDVERFASLAAEIHGENEDLESAPDSLDELLSALEDCTDGLSDDSTVPRS